MTPAGREEFGSWPSATEHAMAGGVCRPIADGGDDEIPGTAERLSPDLRQRIEAVLEPDESIEAFLARAWERNEEIPAVESLADAAIVECKERELIREEDDEP